jgi:eukaryotic-like serine/threonine-protein kinase
MASQPPQDPLIGQVLDSRWEVVSHIASGNFGAVYEGVDLKSQLAPCAIKALKPTRLSPDAMLDFQTEGDLLELLAGYSNVIDLLARGNHPMALQAPQPAGPPIPVTMDIPYLVLERGDASVLDLLIHRHQLPWSDRLGLYRDIVQGVHQMHLTRVVNRDVKSSNAMVFQRSRKVTEAKVSDLGRSSDTRAPSRVPQDVYAFTRGDPGFSAPELIWGLGNLQPESARLADVYLLGSLLFEFATGQGLTAIVIPDPQQITQAMAATSEADRLKSFQANASQIRARLDLGYSLFESEVPPVIRDRATALLKLMTSVDPVRREPVTSTGRALSTPWDLQWVIHRVGLLIKQLVVRERDAAQRAERKRRRAIRIARKAQAETKTGGSS